MKSFFMASAILMAVSASGDVIKCVFTEPFVNTTYSMTKSTLTYEDYEGKRTVVPKVSFQIKGPGQFELVSQDKKVLQTLTLNFKGSDGMSDRDYPYDAKDVSLLPMANNGTGGCTSNHLKATESKQ